MGGSSNSPNAAGGAIYVSSGPLTISGSTIDDNLVTSYLGGTGLGGGIYDDGGTLTVTSSTVDDNSLEGGTEVRGAGIYAYGANASVSQSSITYNVEVGSAAGANEQGGSVGGGGIFFEDSSTGTYHSLSVSGSHVDFNQLTGGASGNGVGFSYEFNGVGMGPGNIGQAGGSASGGGIFVVNYAYATTSVSISGSTVSNNAATSGAGGSGYQGGAGLGVGNRVVQATGGAGGAGGTVSGAGVDVSVPDASVQISGTTIANNTGIGGPGGNGGTGGNAGALPFGGVNGFAGGAGGQGGTVEGAGASISSTTITMSNSTFSGNIGTAGVGGAGGTGGAPGQQASGGTGGTGGAGGNVFGAAVYVPNVSYAVTMSTVSGVTIQNDQATGGAGGPGGAGAEGANNSDDSALSLLDDLSYIPIAGVGADLGIIAIDAVLSATTTSGSAGGDGGFGGNGGDVTAAFVISGYSSSINGSAIVQNTGQAGVGGNGGFGGNGGENDSGPGGNAGNGGGAGTGGLVYGGGLEPIGVTLTVADSTIDGNTITAGMGGAFGLPGTPGSEEVVDASDFFYPALNILMTFVGAAGAGTTAGHVVEGLFLVTKLAIDGADYANTGVFALPQFAALTPSISGADGQVASASVSGVSGGGGVYAENGTVNLINDTITNNTADIAGGVYAGGDASVNVGNSVIAQNTARIAEPDVYASIATDLNGNVLDRSTLSSLGHNFIGAVAADASVFTQPGDLAGTPAAPINPLLGPLQLNGGATLNQEPLADSFLLGAGSTALATSYNLTTDQTGFARSINGAVDIGADEAETGLRGATLTVNSTDGTESPTNALTLAEAVALTNGSLTYAQLTAAQQAEVSLGTGTGSDRIQFASSLAGQTISLSSVQDTSFGPSALAIDLPVTVVGPSGGVTISRAQSASNLRLFEVAQTGQLTLENLTLSQGLAVGGNGATGISGGGGGGGGAGVGGAILNFGSLAIQNSTLSGNSAQGGAGGANGVLTNGHYLLGMTGAPGGGPFAGQANQQGGLLSGGGGASYTQNGGNGGLGGGGGGNAIKQADVATLTEPGAGGLAGGSGSYSRGVGDGGGGGGGLGGAIFNAGTVTITGSTFTGNSAVGGSGAGAAGAGSGLGGAIFNYDGSLTVNNTTLSGNTANQGEGIANVGDGQSSPVPVRTASVTLTSTTLADPAGSAPDYKEAAINGGTTIDTGSNNLIQGVPSGGSAAGIALTLSPGFTATASTAPTTSANELWQVRSATGQTVVADQNLNFSGVPSPVTLPAGLIQNATSLTIDLAFQTDTGGVLLGYQDQPLGTSPGNYVPALYVGTDGYLYAEIYNGIIEPIKSSVQVNDGREHQVVLTVSDDEEVLTLDGTTVGVLSGALDPLDMSHDQLGTGYTNYWPGGNGGIDPFVGTINQVQITANGQSVYSGQQLVFVPPSPVALPNDLIGSATGLTMNVSFQTTADGVILGYQNEPDGTTPTQSIPLLYVGTDGLLHAEAIDGSGRQLVSTEEVDDGHVHQVSLIATSSGEAIVLDGEVIGTLTITTTLPALAYSQIGTGFTTGAAAAPAGYFPFTGTITQVAIANGTPSASSVTFPSTGNDEIAFTPPVAGTYTLTLQASDQSGDVGTASQTLSVTSVAPTPSINGLPATRPDGTSLALTASATDPNPANQSAGFSYFWQATNSVGQSATGSQALSFNGTNQFVDLGNPTDLNFSGQITLEAWIKPESTTGLQDIVAHGYQLSPTYAEDFLRINDGYYQVGSWNGNNALAQAAIPSGDVGQWVFLAGVYNGTQWVLYRDGVQVGASGATTQGALPVSNTDWAIGGRGTGMERFFDGEIDDVSIWNVGRSAAGVQSDMSTGVSATQAGLVAYYQFDNISGDTVYDSTGNQNTGALGGSNPSANAPLVVAGIVPGPSLTLTPPDYGVYTITLSAIDQQGFTGSTSQNLIVTAVAPNPNISGPFQPENGSGAPALLEGSTITLTGTAADPSPSLTADGFNEVWQVSGATGQGVIAAQNLTFNGSNPVPLPSGVFSGATSFTITVTFETTGSGVILAAQDQPLGSTPANFAPVLYVGINGYLYAQLFDGIIDPIPSFAPVNDGQMHTAVINWYGSRTVTYSVDGNEFGETKLTPEMADMPYAELGTGYTTSWPGTPGGYFAFTGTINSITITPNFGAEAPLTQAVALAGSSGVNQITFTPPDTGPYTIGLTATAANGLMGVTTQTLSFSDISPSLSVPSTAVATQGQKFYMSGTFTDAEGDGPWTILVNFGDGSASEFAGYGLPSLNTFAFSTGAHEYQNAGIFDVQVTLTNADGLTASATEQVSVSGFTVNDGSPQDSMVKSLTYTFANPTQIEPGAFELLENGKPSNISLEVTPLADGMTYLITFSGPSVVGGSVPDGHYTLITLADEVRVLSGPPLTASDVNTFVRLFGDVNGDGVVNAADKALLKEAEADPNSPYAADFEYDGKPVIDKEDIAQFNKRYKGRTDPPKKAPAKFPGRTVHHNVAVRPTLSLQPPARTRPVKTEDHLESLAIGLLAPRKLHHS